MATSGEVNTLFARSCHWECCYLYFGVIWSYIPWQLTYSFLSILCISAIPGKESITVGSTFQMWLVCQFRPTALTNTDLLKILRTSSLDDRELFRRVIKKHLLWRKVHLGSQFFNFLDCRKQGKSENLLEPRAAWWTWWLNGRWCPGIKGGHSRDTEEI